MHDVASLIFVILNRSPGPRDLMAVNQVQLFFLCKGSTFYHAWQTKKKPMLFRTVCRSKERVIWSP